MAYNSGNVVSCNGFIYICIAANINLEPPNPSYWQLSPCSLDFPNNLNTNDKYPDLYRSTEIQNPGQFILISEASAQSFDTIAPPFPPPAAWDKAVAYIAGNIVLYNGIGYTCILANSNQRPATSPTDWEPVTGPVDGSTCRIIRRGPVTSGPRRHAAKQRADHRTP